MTFSMNLSAYATFKTAKSEYLRDFMSNFREMLRKYLGFAILGTL